MGELTEQNKTGKVEAEGEALRARYKKLDDVTFLALRSELDWYFDFVLRVYNRLQHSRPLTSARTPDNMQEPSSGDSH